MADECVHEMNPAWCAYCTERTQTRAPRTVTRRVDSPESKQQVADDIARILGLPRTRLRAGSTEPRELLTAIADRFDIPEADTMSKPRLAQAICGQAGHRWTTAGSSRGSTVTTAGLLAIRDAATKWVTLPDADDTDPPPSTSAASPRPTPAGAGW